MLFSDDFEAARGWTLTPGANTATTGQWQRGDPQPTSSNGVALQPGTCAGPSVNCFVTGLTAGAAAGSNDVDGGQTSMQSPAIALPAGANITLTFRFFLAHLNNATSAGLVPRASGGGQRHGADRVRARGAASNVAGAWRTRTVNLSAWAGQTDPAARSTRRMRASASLIEAGFDNVAVTRQ